MKKAPGRLSMAAREKVSSWRTFASDAFRKQTPYNAPFADSIDTMQDFWNAPCYNELLAVTQRYIGMAIDGEMNTMDALKKLAEEKERILKDAGLLP